MLWSLILMTEIQVTAINLWRYKNKMWATKAGLSVYILMTKCNLCLTTIIQLLTLCWQPTCIKFSIIWSQNTAHHKLHILITLQVSITHTSTTAGMGNFWGCWMKTDEQLITTRNKSVFPILLYVCSLLWLKKFHKLHTTKIIKWSYYVFK